MLLLTGDVLDCTSAEREAERLAALHRYEILDTPPEPSLDRITRLLAGIFSVPTVLVSLVDTDRQWFKSRYGCSLHQIPRSRGFCSRAIEGTRAMVVGDATKDVRFAENPLVVGEPFFRFYAGAPLRTPEGANLGTVCLLDRQANPNFTSEQTLLLEDFAGLVMDEIECGRAAAQTLAAERRLQASEVRFRAFMDHSPAMAFIKDEAGRMVYMNRPLERACGRDLAQCQGQTDFELWPGHVARSERATDEAVLASGKCQELIESVPMRDGVDHHFISIKFPFSDGKGGALLGGMALDISERVAAEQQLARSSRLQQATLDSAPYILITTDQHGLIQTWNRSAELLLGYAADQVVDKEKLALIYARSEIDERLVQMFMGSSNESTNNASDGAFRAVTGYPGQQTVDEREWTYVRKDGTRFPALVSLTSLCDNEQRVYGYLCIAQDLTARKYADEQRRETVQSLQRIQTELQRSLNEKDVLLKEVHHRVKNNLQIISSLLSMQSLHARDDASREMFQESRNRVLSIAQIHEHLYNSDNLSRVDMGRYLEQIVGKLVMAHRGMSALTCNIMSSPKPFFLTAQQAIPVGLIVNELVSNGVKHAFPKGTGAITVQIEKLNGKVALLVRDNGCEFPKAFTFPGNRSLGLQLVDKLVHRQLAGSLSLIQEQGSSFQISFPEEIE